MSEQTTGFDDLSIARTAGRARQHPTPSPRGGPSSRAQATSTLGWSAPHADGARRAAVRPDASQPGRGAEGPTKGSKLKAFAAPSALGNVEGDANVCQRKPCPDQAGGQPACSLVSEEVVNLCTLRDKPLVLTVIFDRGADCYPQVDRTERVRRDFKDVNFATVFFTGKERGEVRGLVEARGWRQPVGIDRDGAVANLYGVGGCPTTIFARAGGTVVDTKLGNLTEDDLRRRTAAL